MQGKICVITGANTGIGKAAARALAELGARIVMICRDRVKGERALSEIDAAAAKAGRNGGADLYIADLSSQADVRAVARDVLAAHPRIDVLVNNAGVALERRELTVDGIERTFAVNYLAYFMLGNLLLPGLRAAGRARVINVSSDAHRRGKLDLGNLQRERDYSNYSMYADTKLHDLMFTYALARRLAGTEITVNALHPGLVATEIWRQVPVLDFLSRWLTLSPEKGARTTVYLAASPDVEAVTGKYFVKCKPATTTALSHDVSLQDRLWATSVALTGVGAEIET